MDKIKKLFYYFCIFILALTILCGSFENGLLLTILSFIFIYLFVSKIKIKRFTLFLILFSFITKLVSIFFIKTPLIADYILMYDTALHFLKEGIHTPIHSYFNTWGYQLFHVFYEAVALSIFNSITFLKVLNCIYSTVITVFMYFIVKKLTSEKTARITSLLYSISLYPLYLNTVLGNQQLALMLALIAIYILLYSKRNLKSMIIIGILLALSHLERNEGIIYLLSSIIYLFITNDGVKNFLKNSFVILLCFIFVTQIASFSVIKLGINEIGFKNANPEWKFLLGFNFNTNGMYDGNDEVYLQDLNAEKKEVLNRVTNLKKLPNLFYNKIKIQFLYDDFGSSFDKFDTSSKISNLKTTIFNYIKCINIFIIILAFIGVFKNKGVKKESYFFILNFLAFFGVYMLIEICARYYYNPQFTIFILSSLGVELILKLIEKYKTINNKL